MLTYKNAVIMVPYMALSYMICIDILMYYLGKLQILQTVVIKYVRIWLIFGISVNT